MGSPGEDGDKGDPGPPGEKGFKGSRGETVSEIMDNLTQILSMPLKFVPGSPTLVTLMMEATRSSETSVQEPHCVTSQETVFFTATTVKTSDLT
jgi:hypothetical protein